MLDRREAGVNLKIALQRKQLLPLNKLRKVIKKQLLLKRRRKWTAKTPLMTVIQVKMLSPRVKQSKRRLSLKPRKKQS